MPVQLRNLSRQLLTVQLNSGASVHVAPGETSPPVDDVETQGNRWVDKLVERGLIEAQPHEARRAKRKGAG